MVLFFVILISNFPFSGYLTGWDNLHPEFNFSSNFSRGIKSVWQANQGLGTYGGHGYAATLPHTAIIFLLSLIAPDMYLRAIFTFLCLFIGGIGLFFLVLKLLNKQPSSIKSAAAFLGGAFYMVNFGTVQNFYIQLEAFIVQFAALPFLFLTLILFLEKRTIKRFIWFSIVNILATIQGFIPPLFFVYMMILGIFLLSYVIHKDFIKRFKIAFLVGISVLIMNAYWLLPVLNFSMTRSDVYLNAYNNLSSTEDFILKNQKYGNVENLVILKGFISEAIDSEPGGSVFPIFSQWLIHISNIETLIIGYVLFLVIIIGVIYTIVNKNVAFRLAFIAGFILIFSLLATDTPPFRYITELMQQAPVLKQAFRVAFTKFSLGLGFFFAVFFALGAAGILHAFYKMLENKKRIRIIISYICITFLSAGLIYFSIPIFSGYFIYPRIKTEIPQAYFQMFDFFKIQDKTERIANLPQGWNWGWTVYNWGYTGSGFLWYGIEQPIMDRAFDVWGTSNEAYFWELSHIIYSEEYGSLPQLFEKYHISWVVLDKNVVPYLNAKGALYADNIDAYLSSSPNFTLTQNFPPEKPGQKEIKIYKFNRKLSPLFSTSKNVLPKYNYAFFDPAYSLGNPYISKPQEDASYFPFRTLFSNRRFGENPTTISATHIATSDIFTSITAPIPEKYKNYIPDIPQFPEQYKELLSAGVERTDEEITIRTRNTWLPEYSYKSSLDPYFLNHKASNCNSVTLPSEAYKQEAINGDILRFTSRNSENCYAIILSQLFQRYGYLIAIDSRHISGKRLQFAVINEDSRKVEIEYSLTANTEFEKTYVFLPPLKYYGKGYSLVFNNISIGKPETINDLKSVTVQAFPYELITNIKLIPPPTVISTKKEILSNFQSYDTGWHAYTFENEPNFIQKTFPFWFGSELNDHVLVNNWANGWVINSESKDKEIIIIFLPQYLEYAGFLLLLGYTSVIAIIGLKSHFKHHKKTSALNGR